MILAHIVTAADEVEAAFEPYVDHEQQGFRGPLTDYVRLYAFLAQVLAFAAADLEKLRGAPSPCS